MLTVSRGLGVVAAVLCAFGEPLWAARAGLRAAVIAAVAGACVVVVWSAAVCGQPPAAGGALSFWTAASSAGAQAQLAAAAVEGEPTGDVQQPFALGLGELVVEQQR